MMMLFISAFFHGMYSESNTGRAFHTRCSLLNKYPVHHVDGLRSFSSQVPPTSDWLQFTQVVDQYMQQLSRDDSPDCRFIRHLLGDPYCATLGLQSPRVEHTEKVSALLSSYRIVDREILRHGSMLPNSRPPVPQTITHLNHLPRNAQRIIERLQSWRTILEGFKEDVMAVVGKTERTVQPVVVNSDSTIPRSMAHLQHLGEANFKQGLEKVVQNFREASLHYTFLQELAGSGLPKSLPDIPQTSEDVEALILPEQGLAKYEPATRKRMTTYLNMHQPSQIRIPFQFALLISMVILLTPALLHTFNLPRGILIKLSCAIGNEQPEILVRVESEIWKTLTIISQDSSSSAVLKAFSDLVMSEAFVEALALPSTHPALLFFGVPSVSLAPTTPAVSSPLRNVAGHSRSPTTSDVPIQGDPIMPVVMTAAPVNVGWPYPAPVNGPGPFHHVSHIPGIRHIYNPFAPDLTTPFPFSSLNSVIHAPNSLEIVPFTPAIIGAPSRVLRSMLVDSADVTMSSAADSIDAEANGHSDDDMLVDVNSGLDAPHPPQIEDSDQDFGEQQSGTGEYDNDPMGLVRALNGAMDCNNAANIQSTTEGGDDSDDSSVEPSKQHFVDAGVRHPENLTQHGPNMSDSSEESRSNSGSTGRVVSLVHNTQGNSTTSHNDEEPDDPASMPHAIRRSSRTKKATAKTRENGKPVVRIVGRKAKQASKMPAVVSDSDTDESINVTATLRESAWEQLEDGLFIWTPELTFKKQTRKVLSTDRVVTAWGPKKENKLELTFVAHDSCKGTLTLLESLVDLVAQSYENGIPPHLANSSHKQSVFKIFTEPDFKALQDSEVQNLLRRHHIVVTDISHDSLSFKDALELLAPLHSATPIQDQSLPPGHENRTQIGRVSDILDSTESSNLHILNALSFPKPFRGVDLSAYSSDAHAVRGLFNQEGSVKHSPISVEDIRWGIVATKAAFHPWHLDSDGYGTNIEPVTGSKWWFVARPPTDDIDFETFNKTSLFFDEAFDLDKSGDGLFAAEAILLQPGTRLIMRPNTLHAVYTPQHAVCDGGHYYATSTIRDTFVGLVHTFVCDRLITNVTHLTSRFMLGQMINFYHASLVKAEAPNTKSKAHVPDPMNPTSFLDLLVMCGLGVLINVLSFETYMAPGADLDKDEDMTVLQAQFWEEDDINHMSESDRKLCCLARGQSLDIIAWLSAKYRVTTGDIRSPKVLFASILLDMCKMIVLYKDLADSEHVKHRKSITSNRLRTQITAVLSIPDVACPQDPQTLTWTFPPSHKDSCPMLPNPDEPYQLAPIQNSQFTLKSVGALCKAGETERDRKFAARMRVKREGFDNEDDILPERKRKRDE